MANIQRAVAAAFVPVLVSLCPLPAIGAPDAFASVARLSEAHGHVFKRGFKDWEKDEWDESTPAALGDALNEGMQVGTGEKSWAQITWPNVKARCWANSLYAIAPNKRLVYLTSGEMLYHLDKKRRDSETYFVWTKLLSARIRGTTVLLQATDTTSRITVLEGCIDVVNRVDHSKVRLKPGVVYEIATTETDASRATTSPEAARATPGVAPFTDIAIGTPTTLFETSKTVASVAPIDAAKVMALPLLTDLSSPLGSESLIKTAMQAVSPLTRTGFNALEVLAVPMALDYKVGPVAQSLIKLPSDVAQFFPANGGASIQPSTIRGAAIPMMTSSNFANNLNTQTGFAPAMTAASALSATAATTTVSQLSTISPSLTATTQRSAQFLNSPGNLVGGTTTTLGGITNTAGGVINNTINQTLGILGR